MKYKYLYILFLVFVYSSCKFKETYPGYSESDSGLFYKLDMIGEGKKRPSFGDYLQLTITYKTQKDSIFLDTYSSNDLGSVILPFNHSSFKGSFEEGLTTMNEGDSVSFIVNADSLFARFFKSPLPVFIHPGEMVKMEVKLNRILNAEDYSQVLRQYELLVEDRDIEEHRKLQLYLDTCRAPFTPLDNGMYFLPEKQGSGDYPESGSTVQLQFTGSFLNGKPFESTYSNGQSFEFTVGEQGQVIKGLESAILLLNEGAKGKFIIPSQLAFGEKGSSTGIIPPYTTVVYDVELIKITK